MNNSSFTSSREYVKNFREKILSMSQVPDEQTLKDRLQMLCKAEYEGNVSKIGRAARVKDSTFRGYYNGTSKPRSIEGYQEIADALGVNPEWLRKGEGQMRSSADLDNPEERIVKIPLRDVKVGAGNGYFVGTEKVIDHIPLSEIFLRSYGISSAIKNLSAVQVEGDSMMPHFLPGDLVIVDHSLTDLGEGVFVIRMTNTVLVKRLQPLADGRVKIFSYNPDFEPEVINPNDLGDDFAIVGRVVWGGRRY